MGTLLAIVVFVPTAGMVALAVSAANDRLEERRIAAQVRDEALALESLMEWRAAINDEWVLSAAVHSAATNGVNAADLGELLGIDVAGSLDRARRAMEAAATRAGQPDLDLLLAAVTDARQAVDAGHPDPQSHINQPFWDLTGAIDERWQDRLDALRRSVAGSASSRRPGDLFRRLDALDGTFQVLIATMDRGDQANLLLTGSGGAEAAAALIEADGRFHEATVGLARSLGPRAERAWSAWRSSPSTLAAESLLADLAARLVSGEPNETLELADYGSALDDGVRWLAGATALITAAAVDLAELAKERHGAAESALIEVVSTAALISVGAMGAGALLTRSVARPLRKLADFAHHVGDGDFDRSPPSQRGPRELARTTAAVSDMAATISAVERFVIDLAQDPGSPALDAPLPGRMGRALQTTVDQLRTSMQEAEEHRRRLEVVASCDGLTGLLNRTAALEAIDRELDRCRTTGRTFAVLFVDLDGLKALNDEHGHEAGDTAIRRTAEALVASTRRTDIVGRIGGDEFLVALGDDDGADEAARVAERIRRSVAEHPLSVEGHVLPVRCSIGVAIARPGDSAEIVIGHADQALYEAKARGRNRICWFHAPDAGTVP